MESESSYFGTREDRDNYYKCIGKAIYCIKSYENNVRHNRGEERYLIWNENSFYTLYEIPFLEADNPIVVIESELEGTVDNYGRKRKNPFHCQLSDILEHFEPHTIEEVRKRKIELILKK